MPSEYGGHLGAFDNTKWREQIIRDENYFIRLETYSCQPKQLNYTESGINDLNANEIDEKRKNAEENGHLIRH